MNMMEFSKNDLMNLTLASNLSIHISELIFKAFKEIQETRIDTILSPLYYLDILSRIDVSREIAVTVHDMSVIGILNDLIEQQHAYLPQFGKFSIEWINKKFFIISFFRDKELFKSNIQQLKSYTDDDVIWLMTNTIADKYDDFSLMSVLAEKKLQYSMRKEGKVGKVISLLSKFWAYKIKETVLPLYYGLMSGILNSKKPIKIDSLGIFKWVRDEVFFKPDTNAVWYVRANIGTRDYGNETTMQTFV